MHLVQIKEDFSNFIKKYDQEDLVKVMEFLSLILNEYHQHPMKIYAFFKLEDDLCSSDTKLIDLTENEQPDTKKESEEIVLRQTGQSAAQTKSMEDRRSSRLNSSNKFYNFKCSCCCSNCTLEQYKGNIVCLNCKRCYIKIRDDDQILGKLACKYKSKCTSNTRIRNCKKCRFEKMKSLIKD
ncbi:hypothetical protein BpHYR1_011607 [Brachionus plicatilis]|uniref:Nuclear receptor domain-containing protein n=1 Tax=Brachionus plicatilis TaxID=10195 RepID=A0A3M7Q248_BRAPC|nr:hypothetical protein BpHYR1_011607 [Brachionus plicatilis]